MPENFGRMENQSEKTVTAAVEKLAYTADEACAALGVGRTTLLRGRTPPQARSVHGGAEEPRTFGFTTAWAPRGVGLLPLGVRRSEPYL